MIRLTFIAVLLAACSAAPGASSPPTVPASIAAATPAPVTPAPVDTAAPATPAATTPGDGYPCDPMDYECDPKYTERPGGPPSPAGSQLVIGTDVSRTYLVTPEGYSLYVFDNDSPGSSACSGDCSGAWPPLSLPGMNVTGGAGVTGTFGSFTRDDAAQQFTYDYAPLYRYSGDAAPGETNGDGMFELWHVAKP